MTDLGNRKMSKPAIMQAFRSHIKCLRSAAHDSAPMASEDGDGIGACTS